MALSHEIRTAARGRLSAMTRFLFRAVLWLLPFAAYVASPFATVWLLRDAIKNSNTAALEHTIAWDSVRSTLRTSMTRVALDLPVNPELASETSLASSERTGIWQRIKSYVGTRTIDKMIETYANPEGLPRLFEYRKTYRTYVSGTVEPEKTLANLPERVSSFWSRVKHAQFNSATQFEMEVEDKSNPDRRYTGLLELRGFGWKLVELHIHTTKNPLGRLAELNAKRDPMER
jgi:hypothetical protein